MRVVVAPKRAPSASASSEKRQPSRPRNDIRAWHRPECPPQEEPYADLRDHGNRALLRSANCIERLDEIAGFDPTSDKAWIQQYNDAERFATNESAIARSAELVVETGGVPEVASSRLIFDRLEAETEGKPSQIRYVLLSTDAPKPMFAARVIAESLEKIAADYSFGFEIDVTPIEGLVADDAEAFLTRGLHGLLDAVQAENPRGRLIFNVTGGYKSVIPFSTLISIATGAVIVYTHEGSGSLIELPRLHATLAPVQESDTRHKALIDRLVRLSHSNPSDRAILD